MLLHGKSSILDFAGLEGYGEFTVIPRNFDDPVDEPTCSSTSGIQIDCSPMVYADSLEIRVNSSENVTFCEITIQGFLGEFEAASSFFYCFLLLHVRLLVHIAIDLTIAIY